MHPFIYIGPLRLASYGTMILIGIACGIVLLRFRAKRRDFSFEHALYALIYGAIGLALGAKLFYLAQALPSIVSNWDMFAAQPKLLLDLVTSGFVFYGGLFGALAGVLIYARQYRLSFLALLELLTPAIPLIHAFGRIGCFLAGCCFGIEYDGPFCVTFTSTDIAPLNIPLFPVQLMESALLFMLAAFLLIYDARAKKPRCLIGWYLLLYGMIRMVTELFRGDEIRGIFLLFSTSQWISILMIVVAIVLLVKLKVPQQPETQVPEKQTIAEESEERDEDASINEDPTDDIADNADNADASSPSSPASSDEDA